jgi:hypothetical protein
MNDEDSNSGELQDGLEYDDSMPPISETPSGTAFPVEHEAG